MFSTEESIDTWGYISSFSNVLYYFECTNNMDDSSGYIVLGNYMHEFLVAVGFLEWDWEQHRTPRQTNGNCECYQKETDTNDDDDDDDVVVRNQKIKYLSLAESH